VPVTSTQITFLQAYLTGDQAAVASLSGQLGLPALTPGLAKLVYAAFVIAARSKFTPDPTHAGIIRFVAQTRALLDGDRDLLDPLAAECELRRALLGRDVPPWPDVEVRARAQLVLLEALIQSMTLDSPAIAKLLEEAQVEVK
jgi:hypothetical protein